jgi:hypothetical protein
METDMSLLDRLVAKIEKTETCWIWTGCLTAKGYGRITVRGKTVCFAHRVAYEQFVGPIPDGMIVRHDCDNPRCVNPRHLVIGTCKENSEDMVKRGRVSRGTRHPCAKLTPEIVLEIRKLYQPYSREFGCKGLGKKYGVAESAIHNVISGKNWSFIGD